MLKNICLEIEKCYQMKFIEIATDEDHVHFLVQRIFSSTVGKHGDEAKIAMLKTKVAMPSTTGSIIQINSKYFNI